MNPAEFSERLRNAKQVIWRVLTTSGGAFEVSGLNVSLNPLPGVARVHRTARRLFFDARRLDAGGPRRGRPP